MSLIYEKKGKIAYITLNRPEVMNAMDPEMYQALSEAWVDVRDDPDVWCAIITGAGDRAFTAGADLKKTIPREQEKWRFWQTQDEQILNRGLEVWKPVHCRRQRLLPRRRHDSPPRHRPPCCRRPRPVRPLRGQARHPARQRRHPAHPATAPLPVAMWLLLSGERLTAQEAYQYGLVNKVVPLSGLMDEAERMADVVCKNGPLAVRAIKELAVRSQYLPLDHGLRLEEAIQQVLMTTEDAKEGPRAFAEKRPADFKGR